MNAQENSESVQEESKPTRLPIFLSAIVFPGVGQFLQKRPLAGIIYMVVCLASVVCTVASAITIILPYYELAMDPSSAVILSEEALKGQVYRLVFCLLAFLTVYIVNVFDAYIAYRREHASWLKDRLQAKLGIDAESLTGKSLKPEGEAE